MITAAPGAATRASSRRITSAVSGTNIEHMVNAGRGDYAYTLLDLAAVPDGLLEKLQAIDSVIRVRSIP